MYQIYSGFLALKVKVGIKPGVEPCAVKTIKFERIESLLYEDSPKNLSKYHLKLAIQIWTTKLLNIELLF